MSAGANTSNCLPQSRPLTLINETQHITRRRLYSIKTLDDIFVLVDLIKRERFIGRVRYNVGPGGTVMDIELEESAKVQVDKPCRMA